MTEETYETIVEAQTARGLLFVFRERDASRSSARTVPYAELYARQSAVMETPIEHMQRAAEDERRRKAKQALVHDPLIPDALG